MGTHNEGQQCNGAETRNDHGVGPEHGYSSYAEMGPEATARQGLVSPCFGQRAMLGCGTPRPDGLGNAS